jgi:hypothetical protein
VRILGTPSILSNDARAGALLGIAYRAHQTSPLHPSLRRLMTPVRGFRQTNLLCVALPVRGAASAQSDCTDNLPFPSLPSPDKGALHPRLPRFLVTAFGSSLGIFQFKRTRSLVLFFYHVFITRHKPSAFLKESPEQAEA